MPKYTQPRKTWKYSAEFKIRAVRLSHQPDIEVQQVATGLDIHPFMLSRWRKEYRDGKLCRGNEAGVDVSQQKRVPKAREMSENARLKAENKRLRDENDLLKKWQRYLSEIHQSDLDSSKDTGKSE